MPDIVWRNILRNFQCTGLILFTLQNAMFNNLYKINGLQYVFLCFLGWFSVALCITFQFGRVLALVQYLGGELMKLIKTREAMQITRHTCPIAFRAYVRRVNAAIPPEKRVIVGRGLVDADGLEGAIRAYHTRNIRDRRAGE